MCNYWKYTLGTLKGWYYSKIIQSSSIVILKHISGLILRNVHCAQVVLQIKFNYHFYISKFQTIYLIWTIYKINIELEKVLKKTSEFGFGVMMAHWFWLQVRLAGISQMWKWAIETLNSQKLQSWPRFSLKLTNTTLLTALDCPTVLATLMLLSQTRLCFPWTHSLNINKVMWHRLYAESLGTKSTVFICSDIS